ncbi:MAG: ATP-binding protein, partial [Deltaproteobacteria bacterium]|nr:ATP-binding protein [Deltaproteobacteria bacterium]
MDQIKNPFSPGAGSPPPELVGRDGILEQARILLGRVRQKRSEKSLILVGLRGVGKTVLLGEIEHLTKTAGYHAITLEAHENKSLAALMVPRLRRLLFDLDRMANLSEKVRRGLGVLKSFANGITVKVSEIEFGLDIESERGTADSGDLEVDLSNLFIAVAEAAVDRGTAIALLIDE